MNDKGRYKIPTSPIPILSAEYDEPDASTYTGLIIKFPGGEQHNIKATCLWDDIIAARTFIRSQGHKTYLSSSTILNLIEDMPDKQDV